VVEEKGEGTVERAIRQPELTQLNSFVLGGREASRRADDLLDAAVYAASLAFRPRPMKK
jgi:hypothetical protein